MKGGVIWYRFIIEEIIKNRVIYDVKIFFFKDDEFLSIMGNSCYLV